MTKPLLDPIISMQGLAYMPLQVERLQKSKSWLVCKRRPELAFYIINLWLRAWQEHPCASIEDDADVLADSAGCPPDKWDSVKDDALRGWILCDDGRWYHPTIAEIAQETWEKRSDKERERAADRERKRLKRLGENKCPPEVREMSAGSPPENTLKSESEIERKKKESCPKKVSDDDGFEDFWKNYPPCPNNPKKPAKAAWLRARKSATAEQILSGLTGYRKYLAEPKQRDLKPCHAVTWLNQERWAGFATEGTDARAMQTFYRGSPEHDAWLAHLVSIGKHRDPKAPFLDKLVVPSPYPPQPNGEAA